MQLLERVPEALRGAARILHAVDADEVCFLAVEEEAVHEHAVFLRERRGAGCVESEGRLDLRDSASFFLHHLDVSDELGLGYPQLFVFRVQGQRERALLSVVGGFEQVLVFVERGEHVDPFLLVRRLAQVAFEQVEFSLFDELLLQVFLAEPELSFGVVDVSEEVVLGGQFVWTARLGEEASLPAGGFGDR